jgi:hypothetical protein
LRSDNIISPLESIITPVYVICEGDSDKAFLECLQSNYQLGSFGVKAAEGKDKYRRVLDGLQAASGRESLQTLVLFMDADESADATFMQIQADLHATGFPVPQEPFTIVEGQPKVSIFLFPGRNRTGTLEHILVPAALESRPDVAECLGQFCACVPHLPLWSANKFVKMQLQIFTAACHEDDPCRPLRWILKRSDTPIPVTSQHYQEVVDFLRQCLNS